MTIGRDYQADFQAFINARIPTGDYVLPVEAAKIVAEMQETDFDLLVGWLVSNAPQLVTEFLRDRERSRRAVQRVDAPKVDFAEASKRFAAGDTEALTPFRLHLVVDDQQTRRRVSDMTKQDHLYVAARHTERSRSAAFEAAFHKAIAKRLRPGQTTADVLTEEEYVHLRSSLR